MISVARPRTSPIRCITSLTSISTRRLSTMASGESSFLAKARARSTPPASGETTVRFADILLLEIIDQHGRCVQVIHRHVEVALNLRRVQIERQRAVRAGGLHQIGDQLRGNRHARLVLAVLARVTVVRHTAVIRQAEARLNASIIISNSIR